MDGTARRRVRPERRQTTAFIASERESAVGGVVGDLIVLHADGAHLVPTLAAAHLATAIGSGSRGVLHPRLTVQASRQQRQRRRPVLGLGTGGLHPDLETRRPVGGLDDV